MKNTVQVPLYPICKAKRWDLRGELGRPTLPGFDLAPCVLVLTATTSKRNRRRRSGYPVSITTPLECTLEADSSSHCFVGVRGGGANLAPVTSKRREEAYVPPTLTRNHGVLSLENTPAAPALRSWDYARMAKDIDADRSAQHRSKETSVSCRCSLDLCRRKYSLVPSLSRSSSRPAHLQKSSMPNAAQCGESYG